MEKRNLKGKGEWDYDYKYDTLFFKVKDREYSKSIEVNNIILDLDTQSFLVGMQILDASEFFNLGKTMLKNIPNFHFVGRIQDGEIEAKIMFQVKIRNKIIEKDSIIIPQIKEKLPNSELVCN